MRTVKLPNPLTTRTCSQSAALVMHFALAA